MLLSKCEQAVSERQLTACLTQACETGQAEIVGFVWLTHQLDYYNFPSSLMVTWVFDTQIMESTLLPMARANAWLNSPPRRLAKQALASARCRLIWLSTVKSSASALMRVTGSNVWHATIGLGIKTWLRT